MKKQAQLKGRDSEQIRTKNMDHHCSQRAYYRKWKLAREDPSAQALPRQKPTPHRDTRIAHIRAFPHGRVPVFVAYPFPQ